MLHDTVRFNVLTENCQFNSTRDVFDSSLTSTLT